MKKIQTNDLGMHRIDRPWQVGQKRFMFFKLMVNKVYICFLLFSRVLIPNINVTKAVQTPCYFQSFPDLQKLAVKTLPLSNLFQAKFHFHFHFYRRGCLSQHKVSCQTKVPVSQISLIDKQVKHNVLTAKKYVHAHGNSKH